MKISLRRSDRRRATPVNEPATERRGIALIEVIVAMILLAIVVSSLAALQYSVNQQAMKATGDAYKNGVLMQEVNRLEGIPFDSIPVGSSSVSVSSGKYAHTRTIVVNQPIANVMKTVRIIVTPVNTRYKPDTASFIRTKARTSKVLCTTCGG